jgi:hypothetical protein
MQERVAYILLISTVEMDDVVVGRSLAHINNSSTVIVDPATELIDFKEERK